MYLIELTKPGKRQFFCKTNFKTSNLKFLMFTIYRNRKQFVIECANGSPTASNLLTFISVENIGY